MDFLSILLVLKKLTCSVSSESSHNHVVRIPFGLAGCRNLMTTTKDTWLLLKCRLVADRCCPIECHVSLLPRWKQWWWGGGKETGENPRYRKIPKSHCCRPLFFIYLCRKESREVQAISISDPHTHTHTHTYIYLCILKMRQSPWDFRLATPTTPRKSILIMRSIWMLFN